jgi:hypothetical protein
LDYCVAVEEEGERRERRGGNEMGWSFSVVRIEQFCPAIAFAHAADGGAEVPELMHDKLIVHVMNTNACIHKYSIMGFVAPVLAGYLRWNQIADGAL